ncbi:MULTISPECIES: undecaprenyl-diphosphate phosphatase [Pseudomonas]|jgi:undecaprenyl-diphosphatase|uniref:Undecaprenyl-diphosphatase n=1 Tax=Pseudomonas brassicacearum subsp. neoaurantiaca TaxID=494916 RepID=A0A7V8UFT1_9PSED|nr:MULTISPECIES: undecaprenyl-diphosphate phosphatase [Pseudomonas]MBA1380783.1 undecaprenyl-diphosphate phosphatase [Pseudomonas brassicacearum subsp. neoaurantiaca]MBJ2347463.1 undecaprenyl-diphosphate phosphatase [Pseudomonas canavaninivorans]MBL3543269.1 undecaprenyl-diphosphate phosphatase [Pseudomonas sp. HB05]MCL6702311.1 undecaprenyl-diphosphate phosphatase [Pseudomonas sp. T1.Ur]UVM75007.1 undecaprenyl-diphosphate phosphatase [Pseudomonas canavaninivorans]
MDLWTAFSALILGVVEGLTEFLPISSTGHQIVVADLLEFGGERSMAFNIIIQLGAILAVVWEFRRKIFDVVLGLPTQPGARRFTANLLIAFFPAVILGVLLADWIHHYLFNPITVATALVLGGFVMLWAERRQHQVHAETVDDMTWKDALKVGLAQCIAMIPGTSRSGATIIGGLLFGLSRKTATEFSFFLAMPTMVGAAVYSGYKYRELFVPADFPVFAIGFITAFIFAMIAVKGLLRFIASHSYAVFAWYRIAFGLLILATWQFGWVDWSAAKP